MAYELDTADLEKRMEGAVASLSANLATIRPGRASASMLDAVRVDAYGTSVPLGQVAGVSAPEPRMLSVRVYDAALTGNVERAIRLFDAGLNPLPDADSVLHIAVPELSGERRTELACTVGAMYEAGRTAVRNVRRSGIDAVRLAQSNGNLGSDARHAYEIDIAAMTEGIIARMGRMVKAKIDELGAE